MDKKRKKKATKKTTLQPNNIPPSTQNKEINVDDSHEKRMRELLENDPDELKVSMDIGWDLDKEDQVDTLNFSSPSVSQSQDDNIRNSHKLKDPFLNKLEDKNINLSNNSFNNIPINNYENNRLTEEEERKKIKQQEILLKQQRGNSSEFNNLSNDFDENNINIQPEVLMTPKNIKMKSNVFEVDNEEGNSKNIKNEVIEPENDFGGFENFENEEIEEKNEMSFDNDFSEFESDFIDEKDLNELNGTSENNINKNVDEGGNEGVGERENDVEVVEKNEIKNINWEEMKKVVSDVVSDNFKGQIEQLKKEINVILEEKQEMVKFQEQLSKENIELKKKNHIFESEKLDLAKSVKMEIKLDFEKEIESLRIEVEKYKDETESLKKENLSKLKLKEEHFTEETEKLKHHHTLEISSIKRQNEQLLEHERKIHQMNLENLERKHKGDLENAKELYIKQINSEKEIQKKFISFNELIRKVESNSEMISQSYEKLHGEQFKIIKDKEDNIFERQQMIKVLETGLSTNKEELEKERSRLQQLFITLDNNMKILAKEFEGERNSLEIERKKYELEKKNCEEKFRNQMNMLFEEIQALNKERSELNVREQEMYKTFNNERKLISKGNADLLAKKDELHRKNEEDFVELNQKTLDLQKLENKLKNESDRMKEQKIMVEAMRMEIMESRENLEKEKMKFNKQTQELNQTARELEEHSEKVALQHKNVAKVKLFSEQIKDEANLEKDKFLNLQKQIEKKVEDLNYQKNLFEKEKLEFRRDQQRIDVDRRELTDQRQKLTQLEMKLNERLMLAKSTEITHIPMQQSMPRSIKKFPSLYNNFIEDEFIDPNKSIPINDPPPSKSLDEELEYWVGKTTTLTEQDQFLKEIKGMAKDKSNLVSNIDYEKVDVSV